MASITGLFEDGSEVKKVITKRTKELRFDVDVIRQKKKIIDLDLSSLSEAPNIQNIQFYDSPFIKQSDLVHISKCALLNELRIIINEPVDLSVLENTKINSLSIESHCENFDFLRSIGNLPELKKINIECLKNNSISLGNIPESVKEMRITGKITNLDLAKLKHLKLTRLALEAIPEGQLVIPKELALNLEGFFVTNCDYIGEFDSSPFLGTKKLKIVNFSNSSWEWFSLDGFCQIKTLVRVIMDNTIRTSISSESLMDLKKLSPGLKAYRADLLDNHEAV